MKGTVQRFDSGMGYGFIRAEGVAVDIFVHHTDIMMEDFRTLHSGQDVEFDLDEDVRGKKARNVIPGNVIDDEKAFRKLVVWNLKKMVQSLSVIRRNLKQTGIIQDEKE